MFDRQTLESLLVKHEGERFKPYRDTVGKLTIGVGRNLDDVGISKAESRLMLANDIDRVSSEASRTFRWFDSLNGARQIVIMDMLFNLGLDGLLKFVNMLGAMDVSNYERAAQEMLNSKWASQVGKRAIELAEMMKRGRLPL